MGIRDLLLLIYGGVWAVVVVVTVWRTAQVPEPELWAALGLGIGAILAAFRTDGYIGGRRRPADTDTPSEGE